MTCQQGESFHGGKRIVARGIEYIQSIRLAADTIHFTVEILDRRRVLLVVTVAQEATDDGCLADLRRTEQHHALAVLGRRRGHLVQKLWHRVGPVFQPGRHPINGP